MAGAEATREAILVAAVGVLRTHGFKGTTFDLIADQVHVSRSAVLWHFRSKTELLDALVTPLLDQYARLVDDAEGQPQGPARSRALLGAVCDHYLRHRVVVSWLLFDVSAYSVPTAGRRAEGLSRRTLDLLAPEPGLAGQVRAAAALGALGRPLVTLSGVDLHQYRDMLTAAAVGALEAPHLS